MMAKVIAIDGPAASGKSTVAKQVAVQRAWLYVDSGALYRAMTFGVLERVGVDADAVAIATAAEAIEAEFFIADGRVTFRMDGATPGEALRTERINQQVSLVAAVPEVRAKVTAWLRGMRELGDLVVEGRDIGTAVFPDAAWKFYLDASAEERARRRHREMAGDAASGGVAAVEASLVRRDRIDSGRKVAPLRSADGAHHIDSTGLGIEDVVALVMDVVGSAVA